MKILSRYIGHTVISAILIVLLVLVGMDLFIQFLNEIDDIGQGDYGITQALFVAVLSLPQSVYQFFPIAGLVGCLMGLGNLASSSELIVIRAGGVSIAQVIFSVIKAAFIILIVVTLIGEGIGPRWFHWSEMRKTYYMSGGKTLNTQQGIWLRQGNNFIVIEKADTSRHLTGIQWFTLDKNGQLLQSGHAKSADYISTQWILHNAKYTQFSGFSNVTANAKAQLSWHIDLSPHVLTLTQILPEEMSLWDLYRYIHYRRENGLQTNQYVLAFWQRMFQPLASLIMIFLAVPFIFGPLRSATMGLRMVSGIALGLGFYFINQFFGPFSMVYQLPGFIAASIPLIIFILLGWLLMRRTW